MARSKSREELVALLGEEATEALCAAFGGQNIVIPRQPRAGDSLERAIGPEEAAVLCAAWGGCRVYIPNLFRRAARDARIARLRADGSSVREIARLEGLSYRQIERILASYPTNVG